MARVNVFYDGVFSRLTGREREWVELRVPDFSHLMEMLSREYGEQFREAVLDPQSGEVQSGVSVLNNGRRVAPDSPLQDSDEVAFLVAIAGGADD
ncbi:MAG: MoaD/ThiS family protein [Dehalococcoidia bacterium]